ncbi:hypothetical protein SERLA73DRAFT_70821 [Serpula lacrymans var. lacrymans S7.3]|uniref:Uncharacterized protein n=1 Tax=Serpula lacrymans var. lacrymans (strain S7.3) TaxID=936435 RepID=F8PQZ4_SERL3|nr:hypothetical protein SERLA73DRAFT_70821 [Serpula lacrymans var. lacrymans S7.3]
MVKHFGLNEEKPVATPLEPRLMLGNNQSPATPKQYDEMCNIPYQEALSSIRIQTSLFFGVQRNNL